MALGAPWRQLASLDRSVARNIGRCAHVGHRRVDYGYVQRPCTPAHRPRLWRALALILSAGRVAPLTHASARPFYKAPGRVGIPTNAAAFGFVPALILLVGRAAPLGPARPYLFQRFSCTEETDRHHVRTREASLLERDSAGGYDGIKTRGRHCWSCRLMAWSSPSYCWARAAFVS